jgi:hypothetical protein
MWLFSYLASLIITNRSFPLLLICSLLTTIPPFLILTALLLTSSASNEVRYTLHPRLPTCSYQNCHV